MSGPNIFNYATSELSQDAFICWLADCADPKWKSEIPALHKTGIYFLNSLFEAAGKEPPSSYESVKVEKQFKSIDVLLTVNDKQAIIIEDKINSKQHGDQLTRYINCVRKEKTAISEIVPIYLKTGDQSSYDKVIKEGFFPFKRQQFLKILDRGVSEGVNSEILFNFNDYLVGVEKAVNKYAETRIDDWDWPAWIGFFTGLKNLLGAGDCDWDVVNSPGGAFMGLWWHFSPLREFTPYLQLEQHTLCFKIGPTNHQPPSTKEQRTLWHNQVMRFSEGKISKPQRFGSGTTMTVARYIGNNNDYRLTNPNGILNIEATLAVLKEAEKILDKAVADWKAAHPEEVNA